MKMNTTLISIACIGLIMLLVPAGPVFMNSSGPGPGYTGAPNESSCAQCHSSGPDDGDLVIQGVPANYALQQTYPITISLEDPGQAKWGFQLTVIDAAFEGAGSIIVTDPGNTSSTPSGLQEYLTHTSSGNYAGTPDGPVTWTFDWVAPDSDVGPVTFYAAGNAANNNNATSGDNIYTTSESSNPMAGETPTPAPTATPTGTGPTPTAGPCMETGTTLEMPEGTIGPGDPFYLNAAFCNATTGELSQYALFVVMDAYGIFFFAPTWDTGLSYYTMDFPVGNSTIVVFPEFDWPTGAGEGMVTFYGAVLDPSLANLIGTLDTKVLTWEE